MLQVIHVSTTDEIDRIGHSSNSSSNSNSNSSSSSSSSAGPASPLVNPRFIIHVGRNAKCRVHQTHVSFSSLLSSAEQEQLKQIRQQQQQQQQKQQKGFRGPFINSATRVVVEEGGELHHVYAQVTASRTSWQAS